MLAAGVHDRVETRVGELMGAINTATAELVAVIADVVDEGTWELAGGIRSAEHWVTWQCGVSPARAVQLVRIARRRCELPSTSKVFDAGQLCEDAMAAIARRAPGDHDDEIARLAPQLLHSQLQRLLATMPKPPQPPAEPVASHTEFGVGDDRWRHKADLSLDEGALVEKALTAARSQVFKECHPDQDVENPRTSGVTWVDGLLRMAELALAAIVGPNRRPADRHQVILHIDLTDRTARLHLGEIVPDSIRRYLACDADVRALLEGDGVLAALSSRLRTVDDRMRTFIENRDGGCRAPGCTQKRWLHIHHLRHWEDGGTTESTNLCALCPLHHRLHHLGLLAIDGDPSRIDGLVFRDQHGRIIAARAPIVADHPPGHPPNPYIHPSGERVDWHWIQWHDPERQHTFN